MSKNIEHDDSTELLGESGLPPLAAIEAALERRLRKQEEPKPAGPGSTAASPPSRAEPLPTVPPFSPAAPGVPLVPQESPPLLTPILPDPLALPAVDPANADLPGELDDTALATPPAAPANLALLREKQRRALGLIMQGIGYAEAARRTGIGRRTLYRWAKEDPAFQRALDSWRSAAIRSAEDRLLRGAEVAASTLSAAAATDYRAAAILLKGRGLLNGRPSPAEPSSVQAFLQAVPPGKRRVFELRLRELVLSLRDDSESAPDLPVVVAVGGQVSGVREVASDAMAEHGTSPESR